MRLMIAWRSPRRDLDFVGICTALSGERGSRLVPESLRSRSEPSRLSNTDFEAKAEVDCRTSFISPSTANAQNDDRSKTARPPNRSPEATAKIDAFSSDESSRSQDGSKAQTASSAPLIEEIDQCFREFRMRRRTRIARAMDRPGRAVPILVTAPLLISALLNSLRLTGLRSSS